MGKRTIYLGDALKGIQSIDDLREVIEDRLIIETQKEYEFSLFVTMAEMTTIMWWIEDELKKADVVIHVEGGARTHSYYPSFFLKNYPRIRVDLFTSIFSDGCAPLTPGCIASITTEPREFSKSAVIEVISWIEGQMKWMFRHEGLESSIEWKFEELKDRL